ncbi:MAG: hypothetical protein Q7S57_03595 [bacterium]|nr:hypothetical protein [bacterium]
MCDENNELVDLVRSIASPTLSHEAIVALRESGMLDQLLLAAKRSPGRLSLPLVQHELRTVLGFRPVIDCDAMLEFEGYEYRKDDQPLNRIRHKIFWDPFAFSRYVFSSVKLCDKVAEIQDLVPAHVLRFLVDNPDQMPEEYAFSDLFFWTPLRSLLEGELYVPGLQQGKLCFQKIVDAQGAVLVPARASDLIVAY